MSFKLCDTMTGSRPRALLNRHPQGEPRRVRVGHRLCKLAALQTQAQALQTPPLASWGTLDRRGMLPHCHFPICDVGRVTAPSPRPPPQAVTGTG